MNDLVKQIQSFISKGNPYDNEIEIRFHERNENFSISEASFHRILLNVKKSENWINETKSSDVVNIATKLNGNEKLRQITSGSNVIYERKINKGRQDNFNFNLRLSEAFEESRNLTQDEWDSNFLTELRRERQRYLLLLLIWAKHVFHVSIMTITPRGISLNYLRNHNYDIVLHVYSTLCLEMICLKTRTFNTSLTTTKMEYEYCCHHSKVTISICCIL